MDNHKKQRNATLGIKILIGVFLLIAITVIIFTFIIGAGDSGKQVVSNLKLEHNKEFYPGAPISSQTLPFPSNVDSEKRGKLKDTIASLGHIRADIVIGQVSDPENQWYRKKVLIFHHKGKELIVLELEPDFNLDEYSIGDNFSVIDLLYP